LEGVLLAVDDHRVAGVVAAVELHHVVDAGPELVRRLSLALVAPLGSEHHDAGHDHDLSGARTACRQAPREGSARRVEVTGARAPVTYSGRRRPRPGEQTA